MISKFRMGKSVKDIGVGIVWILLVSNGCRAAKQNPAIVLRVNDTIQEYRTLEQAITGSRQYGSECGKTITLGKGRYFLEQTLVLDERDSGLILEAVAGERAELFGGQLISGWRKGEGAFWVADVPATQNGRWNFRSLLVNGRYASRARYPEVGRLKHETKFTVPWLSTAEGGWERKPTNDELTKMVYRPGDLGAWFEAKNAEITIYHNWDETLVGVQGIRPEENVLICSIPTGHPIGAFGIQDYVVWNVKEGMTAPGQWYLDRAKGQLVYWPLPGECMESIEVVAPVEENVIRLENTERITLDGFSIHAANTPLIAGDFGAKMLPGAISAQNSDGCIFKRLEVSGVTGWGMKLFGDNITVKDCHIHDVGAGGLRLIGSHALIENNNIHHIGQTYPSSIALYIGVTDPKKVDEWESGRNKGYVIVRHNEIYAAPYIGIGIGGPNLSVEYNKVSHVMQDLSDGAGIYATFCENLTMRNNLVRDLQEGVHSEGKVSAYYLDELSDGVLVENNIAINVLKPSQNHMAKDNIFRNNIFVSKGPMVVSMPRCETYVFEKNIFVSDTSVCFVHPDIITLTENLFDTPSVLDCLIDRNYKRDDPVAMELPAGNRMVKADLIFDGEDIAFKKNSAAWVMGIVPLKGSDAGLIKSW